ncbi:unnamed protein product, partial [Heterotrigona itama]
MGVGLKPLEFTDCLTDSPYFRENLHYHERELDKTSQQIKRLIKVVKDLLEAAKNLSKAQRAFSKTLQNFSFECIGETQTEDETHISQSLKEFGKLIASIEDERDRMEGRKKFEKQTIKFCQSQERYLNLSTKKQDNVLQEADATLEMAERHFCQASLEYVFLLQEVQERKKFEFVETLLGFMFGWLTFYHQGHEVAEDFKPYMTELQLKIQKNYPIVGASTKSEETVLDETGFIFVSKCITTLEDRGLEEQGLYRVVGVASKVNKLLAMGLDRRKLEKLNLDDRFEWESKTITSALKTYLRTLSEPLMTFRYYNSFISAAKQEIKEARINDIHNLVYRLPKANFNMLVLLIKHLYSVAKKSDKNLMTIGNLAVCFGPSLLRPEEETVASIMDIKFYNIVVEILIENCERIIAGPPQDTVRSIQNTAASRSQRVNVEDGSTSSGNGTPFLRYPVHSNISSPHGHLGVRSYYDSPLAIVAKASSIDERKNGDYEETEHASHRMPTYLDSRSGRVKLTNANLMYHSADKVLTSGNTSSSSESIASDPHSFSSDLPVKQKRGSIMSVHYPSSYAQR